MILIYLNFNKKKKKKKHLKKHVHFTTEMKKTVSEQNYNSTPYHPASSRRESTLFSMMGL
jgi:hypothetical protein